MTTVTLGAHTFEVAPSVRKRYTLNVALLEIPEGTDVVHYMGRTNKELTFETEELSLAQLTDLISAYESEAELSFDIPDFEESGTCRIERMDQQEIEAVEDFQYYEVSITIVMV